MHIPVNVQRIIQRTEQQNVNLPYEVLTMFSRRTGNIVFSLKGDKEKVPVSRIIKHAERYRHERNIITHNHPLEISPLSPKDLALGFIFRCSQIRTTDLKRRVHLMELPDIITSSDVNKAQKLAGKYKAETEKQFTLQELLPVLGRMREAFGKKFPGLTFREESLDNLNC